MELGRINAQTDIGTRGHKHNNMELRWPHQIGEHAGWQPEGSEGGQVGLTWFAQNFILPAYLYM